MQKFLVRSLFSAGGKEGLVGYLASQARENPVAFMGLLGKLVPAQICRLTSAESYAIECLL
jgi:hypothetical protein